MTLPHISPDARALLRELLEWDDWVDVGSGLELVQIDLDNDDGRTLAAIRELAGTTVDVASRPVNEDDLDNLPHDARGLEGAVVVTRAGVLHIEAQRRPAGAAGEPVSVLVSLGRSIPREALLRLSGGEP